MQYISRALEKQFEDDEKTWLAHAVWEVQQVEARAKSVIQRVSCVIDSVCYMKYSFCFQVTLTRLMI